MPWQCFRTHIFRIELAHALLIRGRKQKMPESLQALRKKRFSWVLSVLKSLGVLNPALAPCLLCLLHKPHSTSTGSAPGQVLGKLHPVGSLSTVKDGYLEIYFLYVNEGLLISLHLALPVFPSAFRSQNPRLV